MSDSIPTDRTNTAPPAPDAEKRQGNGQRPLTPEAQRALVEAALRRAERDRNAATPPKEVAGRDGLEPTRYGDWEINGLTSDF